MMMVLPAALIYAVFLLYPIIETVLLSLNEWMGIGPKRFVGLRNYIAAFHDNLVFKSFLNNIIYTIGVIILGVLVGLIVAVLLARKLRGRVLFETIFFLPRLLAMVVVAVVWGWIFNPHIGLTVRIFNAIGMKSLAVGWLGTFQLAMFAIVIAGSWTYFGFCMIIFMAALQSTDESLSEAALIDGANQFQIFYKITLPQISNAITLVIMVSVIDSFKLFDLIWVMTQGGPGDATHILATHLYREAFRHNHFGYAATIAVLLTILVLGFSLVFQQLREKEN